MRTRHQELMWTAPPISTSYTDPYLLIYTEKSIDIYDVSSGIWIQSLHLSNTYPLIPDGSISLSLDRHAKLIYITQLNRSILSLNKAGKSLTNLSSKDESRPSHSFYKSTKRSSDVQMVISGPIHVEHREHLGPDQAREILSSPTYDKGNNTLTTSINESHSSNGNGTLTRSSHSRKSDISLPSSFARPKLFFFKYKTVFIFIYLLF
jgi:hypothetical protein